MYAYLRNIIGTFMLNKTHNFQGNVKMKSIKIPTSDLIQPRQIVFESYGHTFIGVFQSVPPSNNSTSAALIH
jgi:hypothetical protein